MITVRPALSHDADAVYQLAVSFATSFTVEEKAFHNSFAELLKSPDACLTVATHEARTIGYALGFDHYTLYANGRVAWIEEIMVDEKFRRQGAGEALMKSLEQWAMERGSGLIALATRRAALFYQAIGYEESALYYRKRLL